MLKVPLVVLSLVLAGSSPAAAGQATRVVVSRITDPAGNLRPGYAVAERRDGSCPTVSLGSARSDAWRCTIGVLIVDPCFAPAPNAHLVYCPQPPDRRHLLAIALAKPLAPRPANRRSAAVAGAPLSLAVAGGVTCGRENGNTGLFAGMRISYTCSDGRMLLGEVDRGSPRWRLRAAPRDGSSGVTHVGIDSATF
jgi:hypothetical protein